MKISLVPMRMDMTLRAERKGETLILNGEAVDLSSTAKGRPLTPEGGAPWILGEVTRNGDGLAVTLLLPHGANAPDATRFPAEVVVLQDGPVVLPPHEEAPESVALPAGLVQPPA